MHRVAQEQETNHGQLVMVEPKRRVVGSRCGSKQEQKVTGGFSRAVQEQLVSDLGRDRSEQ